MTGQDDVALLERDKELHVTAVVLAEAAAGEGAVLLAQGPAGIGKTRLSEAVIEQAARRGFEIHRARGDELEVGFPYGMVRQLLEGAVGGLDSEARERLAAGAARLALSLLDGHPVPLGDQAHNDGVSAVAYSLYWLVQELADACPQLLVVDDVQWADTPSTFPGPPSAGGDRRPTRPPLSTMISPRRPGHLLHDRTRRRQVPWLVARIGCRAAALARAEGPEGAR